MTTLIVYIQAWQKKDIICAKQRGTLYVQFHHGPSNLFSGICYRGRSMHIHNIMCLIHLQYNLSRYQLAQGINDWVIASGSCLYVSFKQNSIPHFIVTDNISSLYEQNSSAVFKKKMQFLGITMHRGAERTNQIIPIQGTYAFNATRRVYLCKGILTSFTASFIASL